MKNTVRKVLEINIIERSLEGPPLHKFRQLPDYYEGYDFRHWGWHKMSELRQAFVEKLHAVQGLPKSREQSYIHVAYETFSPLYFPLRMNQQFVWILFAEKENQTGTCRLYLDHSPEDCPFDSPYLYVPAGWGMSILKLAFSGIVRIEMDRLGGEPVGKTLKGSSYDFKYVNDVLR